MSHFLLMAVTWCCFRLFCDFFFWWTTSLTASLVLNSIFTGAMRKQWNILMTGLVLYLVFEIRGENIILVLVKWILSNRMYNNWKICIENLDIYKDTYPAGRKKLYALNKIYNFVKYKVSYIELSYTHYRQCVINWMQKSFCIHLHLWPRLPGGTKLWNNKTSWPTSNSSSTLMLII